MNHRSGRRTVQPEISPSEHRESPITLKSSPKHLNYQVRSPHYKKRQNVFTLLFRKTMTCPGLLKLTIIFYSIFMIICMQRYEQEIIPPFITDTEPYSPPIYGHKGYHHHPRVFVLSANNDKDETINFKIKLTTNLNQTTYRIVDDDHDDEPKKCIPQAKWQTDNFLNCNRIHELDVVGSVAVGHTLEFLGQGWFRSAWKFQPYKDERAVVLKMLRVERDFVDEYFELHRRDAVAMERLTWSPYVMDIYGFCGQSALNELADFKTNLNALEQLDRAMRNFKPKNEKDDRINIMKLRLATMVATGLSHVHSVDPPSKASISSSTQTAKIAHYDFNPRNIAVVEGGMPKLNDFNVAEFLFKSTDNNNTLCGFPSRLHEPWWRAPEEMYIPEKGEPLRNITEKVDVYALGGVLYHILTTHSPRGKMKKERMDEVREQVAQGQRPTLSDEYESSSSKAVIAFRKAMDLCFVVDPEQRGTSEQVATILRETLFEYVKK